MPPVARKDRHIGCGVAMCGPPDLRPAADDVRECIRGGPCLGMVDKTVDFLIGGIIDSEAFFKEVADIVP